MRLAGGGGNQDRSMSVDSVIFPASVTIIKEVSTFGGGNASTVPFPFTATNFGTASFNLVDNNDTTLDRATATITAFGAGNPISITEGAVFGWDLDSIVCSSIAGGVPNDPTNNTVNVGTKTATIVAEEGEITTCTFRNLQIIPTAANVSISGNVSTPFGEGIGRATVTVLNTVTFETKTVQTNSFGNYVVDGLPAGDFYIVSVSHKRFDFPFSQQSLTLNDAVENLNFTSSGF